MQELSPLSPNHSTVTETPSAVRRWFRSTVAAWIGASLVLTPIALAQNPSPDLPAFGNSQPMPNAPADSLPSLQHLPQPLPDLGDSSQAVLSGVQERKLGESIVRQIRGSGAYLNDPEVNGYLNELGNRLVTAIPGAQFDFEFFAIGDPAINAFALPGGFVGVNTGLILLAQSESELASVLGHET